jgi:hypothetical protein
VDVPEILDSVFFGRTEILWGSRISKIGVSGHTNIPSKLQKFWNRRFASHKDSVQNPEILE